MTLSNSELYFVSLGGAGEFGMNLNAYSYGGKWLVVDCGMGFGDGIRPGIDVILPDPRFLEDRRRDLVGMVITHAHEDHIGAIAHLWPRLKCPIYASPFAAALITSKLIEHNITDLSMLKVVQLGSTLDLAPFSVEMVRMTHSTLEPSLLAIRTPAGLVVHTGDWKLDPNPVLGDVTDEARLRALGDEGVLAVVGDSTNSLVPGHSGSEGELETSLEELFGRVREGRIAVTCFSSNAARIVSLQRAAAATGRQTALVGRSLWRIADAARGAGYFDGIPPFLTEHGMTMVPDHNLLLICTGSQGEPRSALSRIADGDHPQVKLERGDTVVFSARAIPGNQKAINAMQARLSKRGIKVVTADDEKVHVSGHPSQDELVQMFQWLRPQALIPTHGEYAQMREHAVIAERCQVPQTLVPENGQIIRLHPGKLETVDYIKVGHLAVDGDRIIDLDAMSLRTRQKLALDGAVLCSLVLDQKGRFLIDPAISAPGVLAADGDGKALRNTVESLRRSLSDLPPKTLRDDADLYEATRLSLRKYFGNVYGKKPWIDVHIVRVD